MITKLLRKSSTFLNEKADILEIHEIKRSAAQEARKTLNARDQVAVSLLELVEAATEAGCAPLVTEALIDAQSMLEENMPPIEGLVEAANYRKYPRTAEQDLKDPEVLEPELMPA